MNGFQSNTLFHHAMQIEPVPLEFAVSWFLLKHESAYLNQQLEKMNHLEQDLWDCTEILHVPLHTA